MTTADEVIHAWAEISLRYDPTEGDPAADALIRNPVEHDEMVGTALEHIKMLDRDEGHLLRPMDYEFCLDRRLWRRGLEAVLQARVLQQVFCWGHRFTADLAALQRIVVRLTFDTNACYAMPLLRQNRSINFVVMPFVYQELLLLSAAALAELHASRSNGDCWHLLDDPLTGLPSDVPPPRSFRKLVARMLTSDAFDPNVGGENPIAFLSRSSPWLMGVDEDAVGPADIVTVLGYSAQDFALSHEIGHCVSQLGIEDAYLQTEMAADLAGFRLFAASWGWRDEVLEGCPLQPTARILLGPIWFFFTAGLLFGLRRGLLNRVTAALDCDTEFLGEAEDEAHVNALASRWQQVRLNLNAYGKEVVRLGGSFTEHDACRLANLVWALDDLTSRIGGWLASMPEQTLLDAVRTVRPDVSLRSLA